MTAMRTRSLNTPSRPSLLVLLLVFGLCLGFGSVAQGVIADPEKDLATLERLEIFQPGEPSLVYGSHDEPFASLAPEYRIFVPLQRVPKQVQQAVLDVEDAQFYQHGAISLKGMARAALRNLTAAKVKEGGSTITQQLAKGLFLSSERTLMRKVKEIRLAREIEARYSKDKIFEMYLNTIYFGGGAYGIEAAARTYFSKSVGQLNLSEAAVLAGLIKAPSLYSPFSDLKRARARRDIVLKRMQTEGHITAAQAKAAMSGQVTLNPLFKARGIAPYFVDYIRKELEPRFGSVLLVRGGLRIYTTLDLEKQRVAAEVLRNGVKNIEKTLAGRRKGTQPDPAGLEGALVALDPASGEIRAMVGGLDYARSQFNRAVQAKRQPGSSLQAVRVHRRARARLLAREPPGGLSGQLLDPAERPSGGLETGKLRPPVSRLRDAAPCAGGIHQCPHGSPAGGGRGGSRHRLGPPHGDQVRPAPGIRVGAGRLRGGPAGAHLGVRRLCESRHARSGRRDPAGGRTQRRRPGGRASCGGARPPEEVAFLATSLLQGAVERGTAKRGRVAGWNVAAKTGTSQDAMDMWFVGFTPTLVTGLWIGYDQPRSMGSHETAGRLAAPLWAEFMRSALRGTSPETPPIPEGVFSLRVNYRTGLATDATDPEGISEYFLRGETPGAETATPGPAPAPSVPIAPDPPGAGDR